MLSRRPTIQRSDGEVYRRMSREIGHWGHFDQNGHLGLCGHHGQEAQKRRNGQMGQGGRTHARAGNHLLKIFYE